MELLKQVVESLPPEHFTEPGPCQ